MSILPITRSQEPSMNTVSGCFIARKISLGLQGTFYINHKDDHTDDAGKSSGTI